MLPQDTILKTIKSRLLLLEIFNHPYRTSFLEKVSKAKFTPPPKVECFAMEAAKKEALSLAIGDLGSSLTGYQKERIGRNQRYAEGPFIKLGKQARTLYVGSSSPDVWNSSLAIATMAASHCLAAIPRNGLTSDEQRQTDIAIEVFKKLKLLRDFILQDHPNKTTIYNYWKRNVVATLKASPEKAINQAKRMYEVGIRVFRVYSPEPAIGPILTTKALRKHFGNKIEIITSFVTSVEQAKQAQDVGADSIIVGVGGGGRCITGVRSGSVIDWPELVFNLRGEISIPVIVEGGASDHVAVTLLLGASGISVSRVASGGTIESPGGALFMLDSKGKLFKPYGGEASARTKFLDGKILAFNVPSFVEGETTKAYLSYENHAIPTLAHNIHLLTEDAILAMVFRGVKTIEELHSLDPSPLRRVTNLGVFQQNTH